MNFDELIMQAARELGIEQYVSVSPYRNTNPVAIVKYEGKTVNREIPLHAFMETDLAEVKRALLRMMEDAKLN